MKLHLVSTRDYHDGQQITVKSTLFKAWAQYLGPGEAMADVHSHWSLLFSACGRGPQLCGVPNGAGIEQSCLACVC